ncbi:uncharacterized protein LOC117562638 isoform X2 [Gymnodraco acuticeps]|uniref:Uncharacterized protein LOC117562638 isoform X2 n=1 Tax=Gymnodraco acuticeps TaxID=8218 RepID=A0A6P8VYN8_GYMAC|nr:uncharacterized protein LOC117562638 isoform X2 [Gymnodraco acuticeps]
MATPEEFLVEWHHGRKGANRQWPVYQARIIKVAKWEKSLKRVLCEMETNDEADTTKRVTKPNWRYVDSDEEEEEKGPAKKRAHLDEEERPISKKKREQDTSIWEKKKMQQFQTTIQELRDANLALKNENDHLKDLIIKHIPQMKEDIASLAGRCAATSKQLQPQNTVAAAEPQKKQPGDDDDDGGGDGGNNNKIHGERTEAPDNRSPRDNSTDGQSAPDTTSGTAMVRTLLLGTFPLETLLQSNLNGGKPKRGDGEQLEALDPGKKAAIIEATMKKWPHTTKGQLGTAINNKLTELRARQKQTKIIDIY